MLLSSAFAACVRWHGICVWLGAERSMQRRLSVVAYRYLTLRCLLLLEQDHTQALSQCRFAAAGFYRTHLSRVDFQPCTAGPSHSSSSTRSAWRTASSRRGGHTWRRHRRYRRRYHSTSGTTRDTAGDAAGDTAGDTANNAATDDAADNAANNNARWHSPACRDTASSW